MAFRFLRTHTDFFDAFAAVAVRVVRFMEMGRFVAQRGQKEGRYQMLALGTAGGAVLLCRLLVGRLRLVILFDVGFGLAQYITLRTMAE
jgi:hypothetical protein